MNVKPIFRWPVLCGIAVLLATTATPVAAQMIHTQTPFQTGGHSFYENNSVNWSIRGPSGFHASFGQGPLLPQFGGGVPGGGLRTGFGFGGSRWSGNFGLNLSQGASSNFSTTTPSLTTMNGYPGSIQSTTMRPFVTGFTPVVGDFVNGTQRSVTISPPIASETVAIYQRQQQELQDRINRTADAKQAKTLTHYKRAVRAEEEDNLRMARANYQRAFATATGPLRVEIYQRMKARKWAK